MLQTIGVMEKGRFMPGRASKASVKQAEPQNREQTQELYDRGEQGFKIYAKGMEASAVEKARFMLFVKPSAIAEMGCGNGTVLELLSQNFPDSKIVGVDISDTMLEMAGKREYTNGNVDIKKGDATQKIFDDASLDTIVFCSIMHEIYTYNGYDRKKVEQTLKNAAKMLKNNGRIIIRDGVMCENDIVYMKFRNKKTEEKFRRFAEEFGPHKIRYHEEKGMVRLARNDAREFMSKYMYGANWDIEVKEQFGFYNLEQYRQVLEKHGFRIIEAYSYLIPWLKETHYSKDIELYKKADGGFVPVEYPDSTMILVGEKIGKDEGVAK